MRGVVEGQSGLLVRKYETSGTESISLYEG